LNKFSKLLNEDYFKKNFQKYNDFEIYNPNIIIDKFIYVINNDFENSKKEKEIFDYKVMYNKKIIQKENKLISLFKNIK
jgi:hypothetical protein